MSCPLFRIKVVTTRSRERQPSLQAVAPTSTRLPWCAHAHSPAPLEIVAIVFGGANVLQCGGDLDRCQVPADKR